jgi:hypothetical protein
MTQQTAGRAVPIVPFMKLLDAEGTKAVFTGSRCKKCGEVYIGTRAICINCYGDQLEETTLSTTGQLLTYTIIYQSAPWVKVPYIAAVVKLPEGPVVTATLTDCIPDPALLKAGMPLQMVTEKVRKDAEGNDVIAYRFKPVR